jgi:hypothetical protein
MKGGEPLLSAASKSALMSGMKLARAKVTLAISDQAWTCTLDNQFRFRGLKLPDPVDGKGTRVALDAISCFQDRMDKLDQFRRMFYGLFERFVTERKTIWPAEIVQIREWVLARKVRG